jgi:hypothetical protein
MLETRISAHLTMLVLEIRCSRRGTVSAAYLSMSSTGHSPGFLPVTYLPRASCLSSQRSILPSRSSTCSHGSLTTPSMTSTSRYGTLQYPAAHLSYEKQIYIDASNPSRWISGREGRSLICKVAAGLRKHGFQKGDCAVICSFNDVGSESSQQQKLAKHPFFRSTTQSLHWVS